MDEPSGIRLPKACRTCAKAKVRCEPQVGGPCKRCRRLNKDCGDQAPGSHRRQKPKSANDEVISLEAKLDRMVALLAASARLPRNISSDVTHSPGCSSATARSTDAPTPGDVAGQALLEAYTNFMIPMFPFVPIPSQMTAEELCREKPFLYLNISMIASPNPARQQELSKAIKEHIADRIIMQGQRTLDLLQGLLVHLAWFIAVSRVPQANFSGAIDGPGSDSNLPPKPPANGTAQLDAFLHLAMAQAISLGLNQDPCSPKAINQPIPYLSQVDLHRDKISPRTLEERRTFLGCYYSMMMLSVCAKDMESFRFSKYAGDCCELLEASSEFSTDRYLVQLVRVTHLAESINHTITSSEVSPSLGLSAPLGMSLRWHQAELQKLREFQACEQPYAAILSFHYDTLEMLLCRSSLSSEISNTAFGNYPVTRLDFLYRCLEATKSFFHHLYSLPAVYFRFLPFTISSQFGQAIVTLSQLTLYQDEKGAWDSAYVKNTIDFGKTVDQFGQKLDEARALLARTAEQDPESSTEPPEIFKRLTSRMRMMKDMHQRRQDAQERAAQSQAVQSDADFMFGLPPDFFITDLDFYDFVGAFHSSGVV